MGIDVTYRGPKDPKSRTNRQRIRRDPEHGIEAEYLFKRGQIVEDVPEAVVDKLSTLTDQNFDFGDDASAPVFASTEAEEAAAELDDEVVAQIVGSGKDGTITKPDVDAVAAAQEGASS